MAKRKNHAPDFKAKVALAAMSGNKTVAELSAEYGVHQTQINRWVKQLKDNASGVFSNGSQPAERRLEKDIQKLHAKIGQLIVSAIFYWKPGRSGEQLSQTGHIQPEP